MAISQAVVAVGTTATAITGAESAGSDNVTVIISHTNLGVTVFLGNQAVTTADGFPVTDKTPPLTITLGQGERLYGVVVGPAAANVNVLRLGVG